MAEDWYHGIPDVLSIPRLDRYLKAAGGDRESALALYQWNLEAAAASYHLLHWVEVGWRNAMHRELHRHFGRPDWWEVAPLDANGRDKVRRARSQLDRRKPGLGTADDLVTEFSFGFWVSLLSRGNAYDRSLWVPVLYRAFPYFSGRRRDLHAEVYRVLYFRNRVMHYEPVFDLHLEGYRQTIYRLLGYLSPRVVDVVRVLDRIPDVLPRRPR